MDKIFITGLKAQSLIGCYDWEREARQPLFIDVELTGDWRLAAKSDNLSDALDYAAISKRLVALCEQGRFQLLEALAEFLSDSLFEEYPIWGLRLRIVKPSAVADADDVGIVVERSTGQ